jgi:hypothetical protein
MTRRHVLQIHHRNPRITEAGNRAWEGKSVGLTGQSLVRAPSLSILETSGVDQIMESGEDEGKLRRRAPDGRPAWAHEERAVGDDQLLLHPLSLC